MKRIILFVMFIAFCSSLPAQRSKSDSLVALLASAKDTTKVNLLNELTKSLWYNRLDSAAAYNAQALNLAESIAYQKGMAEANRCKGVILFFKDDSTAITYFNKALLLFQNLNDKKGIAATLYNQGSYYQNRQPAIALDKLEEALKLFSELHDQEAIGAITNQFGNIYNNQSAFATALEYFSKALAIRRQIGDNPGAAFSLTRIGDMYVKLNKFPEALDYYLQAYTLVQKIGRNQNLMDLTNAIGNAYYSQQKFDEALNYYMKSLKAEQNYLGKDSLARAYRQIGKVYLAQKKNDLAISNFQKALEILNRTNKAETADVLHHLAQGYFQKKDYGQALEYATKSLEIARQRKQYPVIKEACFTLSQIYAARKEFEQAYSFQLYYDQAKDSVLNVDMNSRLASLQQSIEIKNRQTQIDLLSRDKQLKESELQHQKQQRIAFLVGILLFLILVIVLARSNRHKQQTNRLLENTLSNLKATQKQLIQSEKMASLGELTAGIAHEIQNPLNFVNNFSDVSNELLDEMKTELDKGNTEEAKAIAEEVKQNLEKIVNHGKRADGIVKGMLQHSRSSSGVKEPTDINALCDEYLRLSFHGLRAKDKTFNAKFETHLDQSIEKTKVVPQEMGRVILNLINNAFYAVNEKAKMNREGYEPTVIVSTKKINDKIEIKVADNGTGIPQKVLDKIFQPFFTTKPTGQGTGLGLSLSYDIITKGHGGELKVETKEGEGSAFIIQLPVV